MASGLKGIVPLDDADAWAALSHDEGSADDVPELILAIPEATPGELDDILGDLSGKLTMHYEIGDASLAALPHLVEAGARRERPSAYLWDLAAIIVRGADHHLASGGPGPRPSTQLLEAARDAVDVQLELGFETGKAQLRALGALQCFSGSPWAWWAIYQQLAGDYLSQDCASCEEEVLLSYDEPRRLFDVELGAGHGAPPPERFSSIVYGEQGCLPITSLPKAGPLSPAALLSRLQDHPEGRAGLAALLGTAACPGCGHAYAIMDREAELSAADNLPRS